MTTRRPGPGTFGPGRLVSSVWRPRAPASFEEYVAARWGRLVRSAVLLDADPHAAEDLAQTALVRCHRRWSAVTRAEDPDAYGHRVLINCLIDGRRRRWRGETPTEQMPERHLPDDTDRVADQDALRRYLRGWRLLLGRGFVGGPAPLPVRWVCLPPGLRDHHRRNQRLVSDGSAQVPYVAYRVVESTLGVVDG